MTLSYSWWFNIEIKCPAADAKFNNFDNSLSLIDKITEGELSLADGQNDQIKFKSGLSEIK